VATSKSVWTPESWRTKEALQQPLYKDTSSYEEILGAIKGYPPLVFPGEVENLKRQIGEAGFGKRFVLQGGDCVERFADCNAQSITNKLKIILQMSVILTYAARMPVVRIGRIAGQFSKPRSSETETVETGEIPVYKGDAINRYEPELSGRVPDPTRLLASFFHASATLNYIRAMIDGGFADLHKPYTWNLFDIERTEKWSEYNSIVEQIVAAISFMETFGSVNADVLGRVEFFTSHEGLHLGYEEALTRFDEASGKYYNLGAHMLWIGERTRNPDHAHVEYFRGIANPIGVKIGPKITASDLVRLLAVLNPENEPGKVTLITRLGKGKARKVLPSLVKAVEGAGAKVSWSCDPMHANTEATESGLKTRACENIMAELEETFEAHRDCGSILSGVHFELTGENVTECTGGAVKLTRSDLAKNYRTFCDPRLNYAQSMEMAFLITTMLKSYNR
jgi:3-deoxy-7-phosphoheptulonate synthase